MVVCVRRATVQGSLLTCCLCWPLLKSIFPERVFWIKTEETPVFFLLIEMSAGAGAPARLAGRVSAATAEWELGPVSASLRRHMMKRLSACHNARPCWGFLMLVHQTPGKKNTAWFDFTLLSEYSITTHLVMCYFEICSIGHERRSISVNDTRSGGMWQ